MGDVVRVMSFNIRFDTNCDRDNAWKFRKDMVASVVRFHRPDVVGIQEALKNQRDDLCTALPEFACVGVGRQDGKDVGEFCPVLYRRTRFMVEESGTYWLSSKPWDPGSLGWDGCLPRICTWIRLRCRQSGATLLFSNVHLDHQGIQARVEGISLVVQRMRERGRGCALCLVGDFNTFPGTQPYARVLDAGFVDCRIVSNSGHHGPAHTFTGFQQGGRASTIDYIFVHSNGLAGIHVLSHGVLSEVWDRGRLPSDHRAVVSDLWLPTRATLRDVEIVWNEGGNEVSVTGSFTEWTQPVPLHKDDDDVFRAHIHLVPGTTHQYKFQVDGEWRCATDQPVVSDDQGNLNNTLQV